MRRGNPAISPDEATAIWRDSAPAYQTIVTAKCQLITPMYGGGVKAGAVDRAMPIRASGLRGQLRFWWRLLYGANRQPTEVFKEERSIWGGISAEGPRASDVSVRIDCECVDDGQLVDAKPPNVPSYGMIRDRNAPVPKLLKQGYTFKVTLVLRCDEKRNQVVEALRWWASFAGVGARTRRGFGAVKVECADIDPVQVAEVQQLGGWMVSGPASRDALAAWLSAIEPLFVFRQGPGVGRGGGGGKPGRSNWPESDTIRRTTGHSAHDPQHPVDGVYPRAAFGLPIVFHFKDRGDPSDMTLEAAAGGDRMSSPLVLRPYFDGRAYRPTALLLPDWKERVGVKVALGKRAAPSAAWPSGQHERKRMASQVRPMGARGEDVLSAFMSYFEEHHRRSR